MKLRTVAQLKAYLKSEDLSPEAFSKQVGISNMTIRRLALKNPATKLPSKYYPAFDACTDMSALVNFKSIENDFGPLLEQLEKDGAAHENPEQLKKEIEEKMSDAGVGKTLIEKVRILSEAAFGNDVPLKQRALSVGALLYFVNPLDIIPDATPIFGFVDDFAVMTLAITCVVALKKAAAKELKVSL